MILSDGVITERPRGFCSDPPKRVGPVSGVATSLVVSEPRFRRFYKMIFKFFVNDFEISYNMHFICI